jgi:hypothetical protein
MLMMQMLLMCSMVHLVLCAKIFVQKLDTWGLIAQKMEDDLGENMNMWTIWTITLVIILDYIQT